MLSLTLLAFLTGPATPSDFGGALPSWLQLSAVAVLVLLMGVALRVAYRFVTTTYQREVARADALEAELRRVIAEHREDVRRLQAEHADELRALNRERLDKEMPIMTEVARVMGEVVAVLRERTR